jgi:hypothetical protein
MVNEFTNSNPDPYYGMVEEDFQSTSRLQEMDVEHQSFDSDVVEHGWDGPSDDSMDISPDMQSAVHQSFRSRRLSL